MLEGIFKRLLAILHQAADQKPVAEVRINDELACQVIAYSKGQHGDTDFFSDVVDCVKWAVNNVNNFDRFYIYNENWDYKIVGQVNIDTTTNIKAIVWDDKPLGNTIIS